MILCVFYAADGKRVGYVEKRRRSKWHPREQTRGVTQELRRAQDFASVDEAVAAADKYDDLHGRAVHREISGPIDSAPDRVPAYFDRTGMSW